MPQALQAGAKLVTGARVRKILTNAAGLAAGVAYIDRDGAEHVQPADVVVLCANGIGTARLLLLSDGPGHPDGLANSSGLVGRNLMLHPNCAVLGFYDDERLNTWRGPAGQLIASLEFYETRPENDFVRGAKMHVVPEPGPLNAIEHHRWMPFEDVWGESFLTLARRHASSIAWAANTEDLPDEANRVELHDSLVDSDGIPAPAIRYRISENTRRILRFTVDRMRELHEAAGATQTVDVELLIDQPGHLLGTARMGTDPARSVVDAYGRAHDVPNLFVADGSLMVTSGSANPTATIAALALRVAKQIAETASRQRVPVGGPAGVD
jgi:choline dehydrogenase-like flavoprotein